MRNIWTVKKTEINGIKPRGISKIICQKK